jgi:MtN3 and saliva related transmembrane protein
MVKLGARAVEQVGFVAAFCTTVAFVPQLVRVMKLRSAHDVSLGTFLLYALGVTLWLVYGIYIGSKPMIASNSVALVLSMGILWAKVRYSPRELKKDMEA